MTDLSVGNECPSLLSKFRLETRAYSDLVCAQQVQGGSQHCNRRERKRERVQELKLERKPKSKR